MNKILVVDDDLEILDLTKKLLERNGYAVSIARNAEECLAEIRKERPDLIILDIIMPERDGISLLNELKGTDSTWDIPVVMLSAKGATNSLFEAQQEGALDYFIKPCNWDQLLAYIKKYLSYYGRDKS